MAHIPNLQFIEMHDPTNCIQGSNDQPYAYLADRVQISALDADMHKIITDNCSDLETFADQATHETPTCTSRRSALTRDENQAHSTTATISRNSLDLSENLAMKSCVSLSHRSDDGAKKNSPIKDSSAQA